MRYKILALATSAALLAAGAAHALTVQTNFNVTAIVAKNCLVSATDLDFGTYTGTAVADVDSAVSVQCTLGTPFTVRLSAGGSGDFATRLMSSGVNTLQYNLYTTPARNTVFGDTTGGTAQYSDVGDGLAAAAAISVPVHGRLFNSDANKNAPVGNYSDTIQVTVEY
jgi:spore coat protein U-like protein